jgi:3-oxoacyl-[acyl-carrier protein] reductase
LERLGRPEDIAGAVLYLSSDLASCVTGQVLVVDGGMVM